MGVMYVNGRYVADRDGKVSVNDRGFQFGDSVYEVIPYIGGCFVDEEGHMSRLQRSLEELEMVLPVRMGVLLLLCREVLRRNGVGRVDGMIYIQVTRCVAKRNHVFPEDGGRGGLVITWKRSSVGVSDKGYREGIKVYSEKDERWGRCDIKTTNLLANCMAKTSSWKRGGSEAWLVDDEGMVKEGGSSNAWIVSGDGEVVTRHADCGILNGITRCKLLEILESEGLSFSCREFSLEEAYGAREAFGTSAGLLVTPIVMIDDREIGGGDVGLWRVVPKLQLLYGRAVSEMPRVFGD
jgi:D-alanine transaminase